MENGCLVVGLGNPGPEYAQTRHNFGFMVADALLDQTGRAGWQEKFSGLFARVSLAGRPAILLKPQTFMNLSGRSVARAAHFFQFEPTQIIVIHDDLDFEFGTIRIKVGGGTGGHKGLASCKKELGDPGFIRVRLGIGRPVHGSATDYVLKSFSVDEMIELTDVISRGADAVATVLRKGAPKAMTEWNKHGGETDGL